MAINMGKAVAYLELDTSKFQKGFKSAQSDLKTFVSSSASAGTRIEALGSAMTTVGSVLVKTVTVPLVGIGAASLKTASDFEAGMSEVKAISGATGSEFDKLNAKAIEMGAKTKFSASESAEAFKYMAMAGWDASDMLSGIEGVMNLAAASGEDLATVSDIVTDSLTAFGLKASDSAHFADVLAQASSRSNTNVALMGETFKYVAPVAGALGYSVEDVSVAIGLMANSGIKGSQSGTALRSMLTRLAKPTNEVQKAMSDLGISLTDAEGNMKPFGQLMEEMRGKFSGLTEEQKAQYAATIAGQEGMSGLLAIVNSSDADFNNLTNAINNSDGAASRMAKTMQDNLKGSVTLFKSAAESAAITIGKNLEPSVRKLVDSGTRLVESFNNLSDSQQKTIVKFGAIAAAVPLATLAIGKFLTKFVQIGRKVIEFNGQASLFVQAVGLYRSGATAAALATGTWFSSLSALGTGLVSFLSNPIGLGVLAIAGLTGAMVVNYVKTQELVNSYAKLSEEEQFLKDRTDELKESSDAMAETRKQAVQSATEEATAQENLWKSLQSVTDENGRVMSGKESYAKFVAGELSSALGIEIDITDGQIKNYEELTRTIQETINKKRALAEQEALGEKYTEALAKQAEATVSYNENLTALSETEGKYNEAVKKRDSILKEMTKTTQETGHVTAEQSKEYQKAQAAVDGYAKKMKDQKKTLNDSKKTMEEYNQTIQNYEGLGAAILEGDADKINQALMKVEQAFKTSDTATTQTLKEQSENLKENYEEMQEQLKNGAQGITQEMVDQAKSMSDQADAELQKSIDKTKQTLSSKFQELGIEAPQALINSLAEQDPVAVQTVTDLLTNLNNGVQVTKPQLVEAFSALGIDVPNSMIKQIASLEPNAQKQAVQLLMQLQNGEASQRPQVLQQMRDLGLKVDNSVAGGIKGNTGKVKAESGKVGKAGNDEMSDKMSKTLRSPDVDQNTVESARSIGASAWQALQSAMSDVIGVRIKKTVERVSSAFKGHFAGGIDYIPYNNFPAVLHEGERVLTKQENRSYNDGRGMNTGGGDTFNFYNTKPDPYEYARQMKKAKKELLLNM